jgi:hypothetical protein
MQSRRLRRAALALAVLFAPVGLALQAGTLAISRPLG